MPLCSTVLIPKRAPLLTMRFKFGYTGIRVRDLDKAIQFFTSVLGMKLQGRIKTPLNKGEFANLLTLDEKQWLEINRYADDSPVTGSTGTPDKLGKQCIDCGLRESIARATSCHRGFLANVVSLVASSSFGRSISTCKSQPSHPECLRSTTTDTGLIKYITGEFGVAFALISLAIAYVFWKKRAKLN